MSLSKVAVIVLNYNGKDITLKAFESLQKMSWPAFDLIHVDNGSSDGSYEAVAEHFPEVIQVRTEDNLGVAGGYNLGIRWAMARDYPYLLTLNNDIEADPEMLTELVRVAESNPAIGCVGPKTYYYWERERLWSAGGIIRFKESVTNERGDGEIDRGQYDRDEETGYTNGCGMLIRREAFVAAGLWDPLYHLAVEDADWCMRIKQKGFETWFAHKAILYHMVSWATGVYKPGRTFQTGRSTAIFVRRYAGPWQWLTFIVFMAAALPAAWLRELFKGNQQAAVSKLKGVIDGLRVPLTEPPLLEPSEDWQAPKGS